MSLHRQLTIEQVKDWVKTQYTDFVFDVIGFATSSGTIIPLNLEPGTLGNIIEGALIAHLKNKLEGRTDVSITEGGNRHYPDLELGGSYFGDTLIALDIKAARRNPKSPHRTKSRITLYTFGTYLRNHGIKYPQTLRPFREYRYHIDLIVVFDVDEEANSVGDFEVIVVEPWRVASHKVSSTTRDYVGAVMEIDRIRDEQGEFTTQQEFYDFWATVPRRGETIDKEKPA